jgi:hypothetical protein
MIHVHFWPSNSCDAKKWDIYINRAIELQAEHFPNIEILTTRLHPKKSSVLEIAEHLLANQFNSTIHILLVSASDVQEEYRDTFPESILHLDLLARISRHNVIAIIDAISLDLSDFKRQLNSVTNVEKTCTVIKSFNAVQRNLNRIRPNHQDQRKLGSLIYAAIKKLHDLNDITKLANEP